MTLTLQTFQVYGLTLGVLFAVAEMIHYVNIFCDACKKETVRKKVYLIYVGLNGTALCLHSIESSQSKGDRVAQLVEYRT